MTSLVWPRFWLAVLFTSLFNKCRCLKRRRRLFPLEQNQNAFYSVHRSSFYRLLVRSWVEDRENIVYMGMTWTNSNWGISIFLQQRCEPASRQRLKCRYRLIYDCTQIGDSLGLSWGLTLAPRCVLNWPVLCLLCWTWCFELNPRISGA